MTKCTTENRIWMNFCLQSLPTVNSHQSKNISTERQDPGEHVAHLCQSTMLFGIVWMLLLLRHCWQDVFFCVCLPCWRIVFYFFVFLKCRKCIRGHFLVVFGIRSSPSQGFSLRRGIRACFGRYVNQNGWFSGPCLATLLPRLIEIARACNHLS